MLENRWRTLGKSFIYLFPLIAIVFALFIGRYPITFSQVIEVLTGPLLDAKAVTMRSVILNIRLPRAILGLIVGGTLALSGAVLQGIFRNPLVDSGMLGVSNGASFGAILGFIFFDGRYSLVLLLSFAFGVFAVYLSYSIAKIYNGAPTIMLVLGGVIVSSLFSSLVSLGKFIADPFDQLPAIVYWLMGSLSGADYGDIMIVIIPVVVGTFLTLLLRWRINVLSLGDSEAESLGVNVKVTKILLIVCVSVMTAAAVSVSGTIGWIGLIVPHIIRMLLGNDHRTLIPASFAFGGGFLILVDVVARSLTTSEIPIGILTALIGAPFYVLLLRQTKGSEW